MTRPIYKIRKLSHSSFPIANLQRFRRWNSAPTGVLLLFTDTLDAGQMPIISKNVQKKWKKTGKRAQKCPQREEKGKRPEAPLSAPSITSCPVSQWCCVTRDTDPQLSWRVWCTAKLLGICHPDLIIIDCLWTEAARSNQQIQFLNFYTDTGAERWLLVSSWKQLSQN